MNVIIDVNIILSALIKNSVTRKILVNSGFNFYFPEPSLHKIRKYKKYILEKANLTEEAFFKIIAVLFKYIKIISTEEVLLNWDEAKIIMKDIDEEDVIFISAALNIKNSLIWSDDKHFEKQNKIKVLKTKEIIRII